ncbi:MAG: hypothetical protein K2Y40_19165 [Reyranella sp.]|jgi:hypothetical protein|nr:hypothetical protein [Reyranella sp.]
MRLHIMTTISIGLLAAACENPSQSGRYVSAATGTGVYAASNQACVDYGFVPNTAAYSRCVTAEQQARVNYRATPGYAPSLITTDARNACYSYGLTAGTAPYDRCVAREVDARTYREASAQPTYRTDSQGYRIDAQGYRVDAQGYRLQTSAAPAYRTDQAGYRIDAEGYRVDANGYRLAGQPAPYYQPAPADYPAPQSQTVTRDEFGNRYDSQGNRINASGQIIPMRESRY